MSVTEAMRAGEYSVGPQLREWFILPGVEDQCFPRFKAVMDQGGVFSFYIEENERWFLVDDSARVEFLRKLFFVNILVQGGLKAIQKHEADMDALWKSAQSEAEFGSISVEYSNARIARERLGLPAREDELRKLRERFID